MGGGINKRMLIQAINNYMVTLVQSNKTMLNSCNLAQFDYAPGKNDYKTSYKKKIPILGRWEYVIYN